MTYTPPTFTNGGPPAINAANLNAMAQELGALPSTYAPRARGSRTIIIGDSVDSPPAGWYWYYTIQSGKVATIKHAAVGGDTTAQMLARIDSDVLDYSPDVVILGGCTNDHGQGVAETVTRANIAAMVTAIRATGAAVVLRTTPPVDSAGTGTFNSIALRRQAVQRHNAWLKGYAWNEGIDVLDLYQALADPTTGGYASGMTADGVHPVQSAAKAAADIMLTNPVPACWRGGCAFARAVAESGNLLANGVFVTDTNADGVADSWSAYGGGATTLTDADAGITGNWQRVTASDATNCYILQDVTTGYATGDVVEVCGRVRTSGTAAALIRLTPFGSTTPAIDMLGSTTSAIDGVVSCQLIIPGDLTKLRLLVQTSGAAGWIEVAELAIRNLTALDLV